MALTKIGSSGITSNALTSLAVADGTIQAIDLADGAVTNDKLAGSITSNKITSVSNTAITGLVTSAQIANVANTQITGLVTSAQIANTAVAAGTYGGSSNSALITVDAQGRITSASNVAASGYSGPQGIQAFNAPGTFTLPPGITSVKVTVVGGGGGSGNFASEGGGGQGGGFGGSGVKVVTELTGPVAVTVGTGGNCPGNHGSGNPGNSSSFGPYITANGGTGGSGNPPNGWPNGNIGKAADGSTSGTNVIDRAFSVTNRNYIITQQGSAYVLTLGYQAPISVGTGGMTGVGSPAAPAYPGSVQLTSAGLGGPGQVIVEW